jgi:hypothetical protein
VGVALVERRLAGVVGVDTKASGVVLAGRHGLQVLVLDLEQRGRLAGRVVAAGRVLALVEDGPEGGVVPGPDDRPPVSADRDVGALVAHEAVVVRGSELGAVAVGALHDPAAVVAVDRDPELRRRERRAERLVEAAAGGPHAGPVKYPLGAPVVVDPADAEVGGVLHRCLLCYWYSRVVTPSWLKVASPRIQAW